MNIYDTANKLAYEIKQSEEYTNYKKVKEEVQNNLELKGKLEEFEKARYEIQVATIQGIEQDSKKALDIQNLYIDLIKNETMKEYFDAELKFNVLLTDVNKIIGDAVEELIK